MPTIRPMPIGDSFFLSIESEQTPSQIGCLGRLKLPPGEGKSFILEMVEGFRKHLPTTPPFNLKPARRTVLRPGYAWEEAKNFDIDYHLRHSALPQPGGERELAVLISRLHSTRLDRSRPLWECHIIEGLENDSFAIYVKAHHALLDGVAATRLMSNWLNQLEPGLSRDFVPFWSMPLPAKTRKPKTKTAARTESKSLATKLLSPLKSTSHLVSAMGETVLGAYSRNYPGLVAPYSAPYSILNAEVGIQRRVSTAEFDLSRLSQIAKALNGTLNDVALTICGGALRAYLEELNALPEKSLIAQVPISIRPKDDDSASGNAIGAVLTTLGTDEADPLQRFEKIQRSMKAGKDLLATLTKEQITTYSAMMILPFALGQMTGVGTTSTRPIYNVVISNMLGAPETRYLNGAEVFSLHPISFLMQGQALNITLFSYAGKMTFVFTACREALPSIQRLVIDTLAAVDALEASALSSAKPRKRSKIKTAEPTR